MRKHERGWEERGEETSQYSTETSVLHLHRAVNRTAGSRATHKSLLQVTASFFSLVRSCMINIQI